MQSISTIGLVRSPGRLGSEARDEVIDELQIRVGSISDSLRSSGHRSAHIQHTVRYTELAPDRFKDYWR
jgi:hypothetical protein